MNDWSPEQAVRAEPYKVLLKRGEFIDLARDGRHVPYKIYYPTEHNLNNIPVILWSHGFGGNRDGASFISRFLAGQGYIIIHITHIGTDSSLWEGKKGHPWDILQKVKISRETTLNRMLDIPFILDQLPIFAKENPEIGKYMDLKHIGMSGHSFGSMTTQVMAGMKFPNHENELIDMQDERICCGILYSPTPISHLTNEIDSKIYGSINIPLFHMTGTDDASPLGGYDYNFRLVIHQNAGHKNQYLQILDDGDHMIYNGTRGKLGNNPKREEHEEKIKNASFAFWEAFLKNNKDAKTWLENTYK